MKEKTKVLIIGMSSTIGGVETYIMNLYENINLEKFEIDFLIQDKLEGIYEEKIKKIGGKIYEVPNLKRHPLKSFIKLIKIYRKEKYTTIHVNLCISSVFLYALPAKLVNKKINIITHSHSSSDNHRLQHYLFRPILNFFTNKRLACSDLAAMWMFGKKKIKKTLIINNAINLAKFSYNEEKRKKIRKELKIEDKFVIGHIGRFEYVKNHEFLIEIFFDIVKKYDKAHLLLIGTGSLLENIKEKVQKLKLEKNVTFMGICNNTDELYQAMDVFVLPSIFEGLPMVGIEAQACGLKCIFSDNVTRQTDITGNVQFIDLQNKLQWKQSIIQCNEPYDKIKDVKEKVQKNGYDLKIEIKKIEKIYIKEK